MNPDGSLPKLKGMARALDLTYTRRWVIAPMLRESSVAEHSFRVAVIADYLLDQLIMKQPEVFAEPEFMQLVHLHALYHDAEESTTGDIPGPNKTVQFPDLQPHEVVVKVADAIETGTWWVLWGHQRAWGGHPYNVAPKRDIDKVIHYAHQITGLMEAATEVWYEITGRSMENDYNGY